ncbi:MAG TPA: class IV lanthionine synthetase LanL [Rugosimonospora sp.]
MSPLIDIARAVLTRMGAEAWTVDVGEFWCSLKPPGARLPGQGWKLHVSANQLTAPVVLARVTELLVGQDCPFKFARGRRELGRLLSNRVRRGSGGKFITVYPDSDAQLRHLAELLDRETDGLGGPRILSDRQLRPGSSVYYRYGVISNPPVLTNDGMFESMFTGPDGELIMDVRRPLFSPPPWAVPPLPAPVSPAAIAAPSEDTAAPVVLIGDRFEVRGAIRHSYRGGVYRAVDQDTGTEVVLKQARRHTLSSLIGTDACDMLRHEAEMLDLLGPLGVAPHRVALVPHQDSLYLAEELVPGQTLNAWVVDRAAPQWHGAGAPWPEVLDKAHRLVELVDVVHRQDLVLCDLKPNNVMVTPDGQLRLIDLECVVRNGSRVLPFATPGYAAPEQINAPPVGPAPSPRADLFGLGATIFYLASGIEPVLPTDRPASRRGEDRRAVLLSRAGARMPTVRVLAPPIAGLTRDEPEQRWSLEQAREFLAASADRAAGRAPQAGAGASPGSLGEAGLGAAKASPAESDRLLADGLRHSLRAMTPERRWLWSPGEGGRLTDRCCVQHGAAGVLAVLTRAAGTGVGGALRDGIATVAHWIDRRCRDTKKVLPGLYFGRSGIAWALYDAATLLGDGMLADRALDLIDEIPVRWPNPDVCHGVAGAGMAHLHLWTSTGNPALRERAVEAADALLDAAVERGRGLVWPVPTDFDSGFAGQSNYGFAHGVAGIGAFLLYAGLATGRPRYLDAARRAGVTLVAGADTVDGAAYWAAAVDGDTQPRVHWCHGSSGVGTFLIRLWAVTGEPRVRELAEAAATAVYRGRWYTRHAACHGLAGDAEFLLDVADLTGEAGYHDWALECAGILHARHAVRDELMVLTDAPDDEDVFVEYNSGLAGAIGFLLRLRHGGPRWWMLDHLLPAAPAQARQADHRMTGQPVAVAS